MCLLPFHPPHFSISERAHRRRTESENNGRDGMSESETYNMVAAWCVGVYALIRRQEENRWHEQIYEERGKETEAK